jgi:hypothetical protein
LTLIPVCWVKAAKMAWYALIEALEPRIQTVSEPVAFADEPPVAPPPHAARPDAVSAAAAVVRRIQHP